MVHTHAIYARCKMSWVEKNPCPTALTPPSVANQSDPDLRRWEMLGDAGLLVHIFDGWENHEQMWRTSGDISTSLLHAGQHNPTAGRQTMPIFHAGAGFIFKPGSTPIACGKGGDSGAPSARLSLRFLTPTSLRFLTLTAGGHCGGWCPHISPNEILDESWRHVRVNGDGCGVAC